MKRPLFNYYLSYHHSARVISHKSSTGTQVGMLGKTDLHISFLAETTSLKLFLDVAYFSGTLELDPSPRPWFPNLFSFKSYDDIKRLACISWSNFRSFVDPPPLGTPLILPILNDPVLNDPV